jgi:hypothetical protein
VFIPLNISISKHLLAGGIWVIDLVCMCTKEQLDVAIKASIEYEKVSGKTSHEHVLAIFLIILPIPPG